MKRLNLIIVLLIAAACYLAAQSKDKINSPSSAEPVPIAFVGFESKDISASGLDILSELVLHEITISPNYTLVERTGLARLLKEQQLQLSDLSDSRKPGGDAETRSYRNAENTGN